MAVTSPVSERLTVVALLLLTFATGLADSISILVLGHVFVANMTGNVIFLGFWLAPKSNIDLTAVVVALPTFVSATILGGRLMRHFGDRTRRWLTTVFAIEIVLLVALSILAGTGVLRYQDNTKLIMIGFLAMTFGLQHSTARQFGIQELSTTVLTSTIVGIGVDSRLAGGTGARQKLRLGVVLTMCSGAIVGATMSRFVVAPVFVLTAAVVALSLLIFRFGPSDTKEPVVKAN
ncbi:MAG: YoaK family protein [Mycobacterium sp.]